MAFNELAKSFLLKKIFFGEKKQNMSKGKEERRWVILEESSTSNGEVKNLKELDVIEK